MLPCGPLNAIATHQVTRTEARRNGLPISDDVKEAPNTLKSRINTNTDTNTIVNTSTNANTHTNTNTNTNTDTNTLLILANGLGVAVLRVSHHDHVALFASVEEGCSGWGYYHIIN